MADGAVGILSGQAAQPKLEPSQGKELLPSPPVPARHPRRSLTAARDRQQELITKSCSFSKPSRVLSPFDSSQSRRWQLKLGEI